MATKRTIDIVTGSGQTTDGTTWVTIASYAFATDAAAQIEIMAVGKNAAGNSAQGRFIQGFERVSGTTASTGSLQSVLTFAQGSGAGLSSCNARININNGTLELQVKGVNSTNLEWFGSMELTIH